MNLKIKIRAQHYNAFSGTAYNISTNNTTVRCIQQPFLKLHLLFMLQLEIKIINSMHISFNEIFCQAYKYKQIQISEFPL